MMNSLEWRIKRIEELILGKLGSVAQIDRIISQSVDQDSILDQLNHIAAEYKNFVEGPGENYSRFIELRTKHIDLLDKVVDKDHIDETSKAELVLAYEEDLTKYMNDLKTIVDKAEMVLKEERWPDLNGVMNKLDRLQRINKEQHIQTAAIDKKTESLIEIYNEILMSFKSNMVLWNQKLVAYEDEEKKMDEE